MEDPTLGKTLGWAGAVLGGLLGIIGGVIGTYFSVRNTNGPRERAFVIRASILCWVGVCAFVAGMWLAPAPYKFGLVPIYLVALLAGIRRLNKRQAELRAEDSQNPR